LKLGQLGIPYEVAQIHTKPETVTSFNIDWLTEIVNNGEANFVTKVSRKKNDDGEEGQEIKTRINLQYAMFRKGTELLHGDIIVRGDGKFKVNMEGEVIIPKNSEKIPKGTTLIKVQTGNEVLQDGDRLIRDKKWVEAKSQTKKKITLNIGDIVERHLRKGDITIFNRQPRFFL
jgi:DNA-directed RNA polymerase beta' subunit